MNESILMPKSIGSGYKTYCKNCIFQVEKGKCYFDRINKFKEQNHLFIDDEDDNNYIITRACNYFRNQNFLEQNDNNLDLAANKTINYNLLQADFVIIDSLYSTLEDFKLTLGSCIQYLRPKNIIFVSDKFQNYEIIPIFQKLVGHLNIKYHFVKVLEEVTGESNRFFMDVGLSKVESTFVGFLKSGLITKIDLLNLNNCINEKLERIIMVSSNEPIHDLLCNSFLAKNLKGNSLGVLENRIENLAKEQNKPNMIKTWNQINQF